MAHYDAIGIGIPYYDIIVPVPADELQRLGIKPGDSVSLPIEIGMALAGRYGSTDMCGGPVANTLAGMAALGMTCGHIGALGNDPAGDATRANLAARGIAQLYGQADGMRTPLIYVLVTPDGERSFIFFINSGEDIRQGLLPDGLGQLANLYYSQLKFIGRGGLIPLFQQPFAAARKRGAQVVYGLQSFNRQSEFTGDLHRLVAETATIVIGNDEEMDEFMAGGMHADIMLVRTLGKDGVEISHDGQVVTMRPEPVTGIVDTIGAGDQFAAGFLYGIQQGLPPERCAQIGFKTAGCILRQQGGQPPLNNKGGTDWRELAA